MDKNQIASLRQYITGDYGRCCDKLFATLVTDPRFNTGLNENDYADMPLDEYRRVQLHRARALPEYEFIETENVLDYPVSPSAFCDAVSFIEWGAAMKYFLNRSVGHVLTSLRNKNLH